MNVKLAQSFTFLLLCVNICVAYHFYNPSASVTIGSVTYSGVTFYADSSANAQQLVYPTNPNSVTETEMYSNNARYQICSSSSCSAYFLPYTLPNYQLTGLSPITSNVFIGPSNNINTNYYKYTDSEGFLVELWAIPNSNPANIVQVKQSGQGLNRKIYFGTTNDFTTTRTLSAPSNTQYPGCATKVQCDSAMDIVLVVDTSGSILPADYVTETDYVQSVVQQFSMSTVGVHMGYVTFSSAAYIRSNLTSNQVQLLNVIQNTAQDFGETNIGGAINAASDIFKNTGRSNVPHVIILLTDGNANVPSPAGYATQYMTVAATDAKNSGTLIYAIGVGAQLETQLQLISSGPSYVSNVANFGALSSTLSSILQTVCVGGDSNACSSSCSNTQFCGCETCLCAQSSSICGSRGVFNTNTCACECSGNWRNNGAVKDCSYCPLTCAHGTKNTGDCTCSCTNNWSGNTCSDCPVSCTGNTYNKTDCQGCACSNFWSGNDCTVCDNNLPQVHCYNGGTIQNLASCSGCTCKAGTFYTSSSNCQTCDPQCKNGGKALSDCTGCDCSGLNFNGAKCENCALDCHGHGSVINTATCNKCQCNGLYTQSSNCRDCSTTYCKNGGTTNPNCDGCVCTGNWVGDDCTTCNLNCGTNKKPNTACTACICVNNNYNSSDNCASCVNNVCENGHLDLSNACQTCVCNTNATGTLCDQCSSSMCNNRGDANSACTACTCTAKYAVGDFCETCDTSNCLHGSTMKSSCDACTCKKGWTGDACDTCSRTNFNVIPAPCVNNSLSDTCVTLNSLSNNPLGKVCFNTNSIGYLVISVSISNSNDGVANIYVELNTVLENLNVNNINDYTNNRSPITTAQVTTGTTYYVIVKVQTNKNNVGYSAVASGQPSYNVLEIKSCSDCVCNLNCHNGKVYSTACDKCTCNNFWSGAACDVCDTTDTSTCSSHGHLAIQTDGSCGCSCNGYWGGAKCDVCNYQCQNGGQKNSVTCDSCTCSGGWGGNDCSQCLSSLLCYGRGTVSVECSKCNCDEPWGGDRCDQCQFECNDHGHGNDACDACVCDAPWTGDDCLTCSDELLCNGRGTATDETCSKCTCDEPWGGDHCEICEFSCNGHGSPEVVNCDSCTCNGAFTVESNCLICDFQPNCTYCNRRGNITDLSTCEVCTCEDYWGGDKCETCLLDCHNGTQNADCTECVCNGQYTSESNCLTCPLICNNGGKPNAGCTACQCVNGWGGTNCDDCQENPSNCKHSSTLNIETCSCDCPEQWSGRLCDTCQTNQNLCHYPDQGFLLTSLNGITICQCACAGYWQGTACDECTLDPRYGDATCGGTRVVDLATCSCHCPKYYDPLDESCQHCTISTEDCVHPLVEGQQVDLVNCNCGPCRGNYGGRDCSECLITSCPLGYAFNEDECTCDVVCGNDILSEGEECEVGLMDTVDQACCTDCHFNSNPCDDEVSCTYDDLCISGTCSGLSGIDFTTDQNRKPMEPGVIPPNAFSRLGVTITSENTVPVLYDTKSNARSNLLFPNPNVYGGSNEFGLVIVQQTIQTSSSICLNFATPLEYSLASILGVSKDGTIVSMLCGNGQEFSYSPKKWTSVGGYGGVEYISIPCGSNGLAQLCYINLNDAAIGPLTSCGTAELPLGAIGDYVWSDYNRDNVQDSGEPGISGALVTLYGENNLQIASTLTNANGLYLFNNLYAGNYKVQFTGPTGWVFSTPLNLDGVFSNRATTDTFVLSQGQTDLTRDAGLYFFGQIGDYVWNDKNQDGIQSPASEPGVSGVVVNLYYSEDTNTIIKTTTTDASGFYIFNDLLIIKSANTFYSYTVEVIPPPKALITAPYQGSSASTDSNFDVNTHLSNSVVLGYTASTRSDVTIDCGIYYCCGSIGDYVWYDTIKNGIQDSTETGAASVTVVLYWNGAPRETTTTDASGYYLFSRLPLTGEYVVHFSKPSPANNYVFTQQSIGPDREKDSDADVSGISGKIFLTEEVPDVRSVDAGVVLGCTFSSDCAATDNKCVSATCVQNVCQYVDTKSCQISTDPCTLYQCNPSTGNCDLIATGEVCDDGNICTTDDKCTVTGCKGTPNTISCDDNNLCTTDDKCSAGRCSGTTRNCAPSTNQCKTTLCDPIRGCYEDNLADNTPCNDGLKCTVGDVCKSGQCVAGPRVTCQPNDACHTYDCSESTGQCTTTILTNSNCNDRNDCTENDKCTSDGVCAGTPKVCSQVGADQCHTVSCSNGICVKNFIQRGCDDNNACTLNDACVPSTGNCQGTPKFCPPKPCQDVLCNQITGDCLYTPNNALSCSDNNPCTIDACVNGQCVHTSMRCDDTNPCTDDECIGGQCVHIDNFSPCDDLDPCTTGDSCSKGSCKGTPKNCDDGEICTEDICVSGSCVHNPVPSTTSCDDGNKCTPHSYCVSGKCQGYDSVVCDDHNVCTDDICDLATGECTFTYNESPCNDNDACTENGKCSLGTCVSEPVNCEPVENICLLSVCANGQCSYQPDPSVSECDDFNKCTVDDKCISGVCTGTPLDCSSTDVCYDAVCLTDQGCVISPNKANCNDNNPCTINDKCANGECAGTPLVCDDNNPCTDDECRNGVCVYTPNNSPCSDKNPCTVDDVCSNSQCVPGASTVCDDSNICTIDKCNLLTGECEFAPVAGADCNDFNPCTVNDICLLSGQCHGTPTVCTGSNPCYDYFCNALTGQCDSKPNTAVCEDNDPCTSSSRCSNGQCVGVPVNCPSLSECVDTVCDANQNGICVPSKLTGKQCSDSNACTKDDVCTDGQCTGTHDPNCETTGCNIDNDCTPIDNCHTVKCENNQCVYTVKSCPLTGNPCTRNVCSLSTGECTLSNVPGVCDDGDKCTLTDVCVLGQCVGTNPKRCSTTASCQLSTCNKDSGNCDITQITDNVTPCDDHNSCTLTDVCTTNGCAGTPVTCNDNNLCTTDSCVNGVCEYVNNINPCSDGNACTSNDYCSSGECNPGTPLNCDDGNVCTSDSCVAGECSNLKLSFTPCDDGDLCTTQDTCSNGECSGVTTQCDDHDPCTLDICDPSTGRCIHPPAEDGTTCNDNDLCTNNDECQSGKCTGTSYCPPADAIINECITYTCDPEVGGCIREFTTASCTNDKNCFQTAGVCSAGECKSDPVECNDNLYCTVDRCNPDTGICEFKNNNVTCSPTVPDGCHEYICINSICSAINPKDCDDKNSCTRDSCLDGECKHEILPFTHCCDGNSCTVDDLCSDEGICVGTPVVCEDDNNVCTDEVCVEGECVSQPNEADCTTTDKCATASKCSNKECVVTASITCPAHDCYDAQCNPTSGVCEYTANDNLPCSDDKVCTNDFCRAGVCQHTEVTCTNGNAPCVDYVCDNTVGGCTTRPNNNLPCADSDLCTIDSCNNGECVHSPKVCADDNLCTYGSYCNSTDGSCGGNVPYSCLISPCLNYNCVGDGTCILASFSSTYQPIVYLSVYDSKETSVSRYKIVALNATSTNLIYYVSNFNVPLNSIDIDPATGVVYDIGPPAANQVMSLNRLSKSANLRIQSKTVNVLKALPTTVSSLTISLRPKFVAINSYYTHEIWGFDKVTDTFYVYKEDGTPVSTGVYAGPLDASLISWDHYGRSAFYFKNNDKTIYLWQLDSSGHSFSVALCNNVDFGTGTIVALDTAVDGTLWVGTNNPISLTVVTPTLSSVCSYSNLQLPTNVTASGNALYSLTVDNTFCPVAATTGTVIPPPPTNTGVVPPPPPPITTGSSGSPAAPVSGNLAGGAASGNNPAFPGQDTNYPLTGTTGYATTAVVGTVAGVAVLFAAIFGAVLGLNTSKEDKTVPLDTLLATQDVQSVASDSPIFVAPNLVQQNVLNA